MKYGKLIGMGRQAKIYEWGRNEIIKVFDSTVSNSVIENEYKKSTVVHELGIHVPYVKEILDIDGQKGIIYEKLIGNTLLKNMKSNPFKIKKSIQMLAENHVKLSDYSTNELPNIKKIIKDSMKKIDDDILDQDKKKLINKWMLPAAILRLSYNLPEERNTLVKVIDSMLCRRL